MLTPEQVPEIIAAVQQRLREAAARGGVHLSVSEKDSTFEDDWLYVCVTPDAKGESASDYANLMSDIEKELRKEGTEHVLLVPAIAE